MITVRRTVSAVTAVLALAVPAAAQAQDTAPNAAHQWTVKKPVPA